MQSDGEEALIVLAKQYKIPILSSHKLGIINGSAFGSVADFYTFGKMSGEMAAQILSGTATPAQ
jgi:putative ABC transport system substrate-binding protein